MINAYREAAKQSIDANKIMEKEPSEHLVLTFAYPDMNRIMKLVKQLDLKVIEQNFVDRCELSLTVSLSKLIQTKACIKQIPGITLEIKKN